MAQHLSLAFALVLLFLVSGCGESEQQAKPQPEAESRLERRAIAETATVTGGTVRGSVGVDGLKQFHGIPYAAAPVGELRWVPPAPVIS